MRFSVSVAALLLAPAAFAAGPRVHRDLAYAGPTNGRGRCRRRHAVGGRRDRGAAARHARGRRDLAFSLTN
jgi:hypothetical protein